MYSQGDDGVRQVKLSVSMTWEMPQCLSELAAFLEDPDWISRTLMVAHNLL